MTRQLFELSHIKGWCRPLLKSPHFTDILEHLISGEILESFYDKSLNPDQLLDATTHTSRRLESFYRALPEQYRYLHDTWIAERNILEEGKQTSSQGKLSTDDMFAAAHVILEYTVRQLFVKSESDSETDDHLLGYVQPLSASGLHQ